VVQAKIALLPGDGVGPEILQAGRAALDAVARVGGHSFTYTEGLIGGAAIDAEGTALGDATVDACRQSDAILLGAVGGPKWDNPTAKVRPEQGLLRLRKDLGLYANLRPVKLFPALVDASPLKREIVEGTDVLVVRELTGGLYFGRPSERREGPNGRSAVDTMVYDEHEVRRVVRLACEAARKRGRRVTSVDKQNVLSTSRLWREVATETAGEFPDITLEHMLVDTAAMRLIQQPKSLDVVVTENTFGDILTDEASMLAGSMGLLPSASLGEGTLGVYEPIHGSAPDIAGKGIANPVATILSVALLLRYSLGLEQEAVAIERAVEEALQGGARTRDIADSARAADALSTADMTARIVERIAIPAIT
jgi:3-isopropylmalate dehydrogenase